jgi:riboflavin kinase/FMN adenylyltransferase
MMKLKRGIAKQNRSNDPCVATMGSFDGLHLGHQALLQELKKVALLKDLPSMVITFEPLPKQFFRKETPRLMPFKDKFLMLQTLGIDILQILRFDKQFSNLSAKDFLVEILIKTLNVKHLVIGEDFCFGQGRKGNIDFLSKMQQQYHFEFSVCKTYHVDENKVSSSRIREALKLGRHEEIERLLGRKRIKSYE